MNVVSESDGGFEACVELKSGTIGSNETVTIFLTGEDASAVGETSVLVWI